MGSALGPDWSSGIEMIGNEEGKVELCVCVCVCMSTVYVHTYSACSALLKRCLLY